MKKRVNYFEDLGDTKINITVEETGPKLPDNILKKIVGNYNTKIFSKSEETNNKEE